MINALGLLEVSGLVASIEAADAMLKTAQVRLLSQTITPPGLVTLVIEGDLAACRAALDAGAAAASRLGHVIAKKEIGRPESGTEWFVTSFNPSVDDANANIQQPTPVVAKVEDKVVVTTKSDEPKKMEVKEVEVDAELSESTLLAYIAKHPQGCNVTEVINYFNANRADIKTMLKNCIGNGAVHKRGNRYYLVEAKK